MDGTVGRIFFLRTVLYACAKLQRLHAASGYRNSDSDRNLCTCMHSMVAMRWLEIGAAWAVTPRSHARG